MPEPTYGIPRAQIRTDVPARRFDSLDTGATVRRPDVTDMFIALGFVAIVFLTIALFHYVFERVEAPLPAPSSREASLDREVGALSTRVVDLERRNAATLAALAGSSPVPTPTPVNDWTYNGPYLPTNNNAR